MAVFRKPENPVFGKNEEGTFLMKSFDWPGATLIALAAVPACCETWGNEMSRDVVARNAILLSDGTIYQLGGRR